MGCFVAVDLKWLTVFCLSWGAAACAAPERRTGPVAQGGEVRSLEDAARLAVLASISDDTALATLPRASLTGAEIRAMCPGARIPDQVEPALVDRYIRAQCPRGTDRGCVAAHLDDTGAFTFEAVDPAWWGAEACPDLKIWRIVVPSIECERSHGCDADPAAAMAHQEACEACHAEAEEEGSTEDEDGEPVCVELCSPCGWGETSRYMVDDVFAVAHPSGVALVWSFPALGEAALSRPALDISNQVESETRVLRMVGPADGGEVDVFFCGKTTLSGL